MITLNEHIVSQLEDRIRFVDYCIGVFPQLMTKNAVKKAIKRKELLINGVEATTGYWMNNGDVVKLIDLETRLPKPFQLAVPIVYEDDFLVIVNKPSGISVSGNLHKTLENALVGKVKLSTELDAFKWAKPVHRLDLATSGLVLFSKTATTHRRMAKQFENREVEKEYHAILMGALPNEKGVIQQVINEQDAMTFYEQLKTIPSLRSKQLSLVCLSPKTGRTHQLRIHSAQNSCPIVGDKMYGDDKNTLLHKGLFLVSTRIKFSHPMTNEKIDVSIPIPHKFMALLEREERRWKKFNSSET